MPISKNPERILNDGDVERLARMPDLIEVCRQAVLADAYGTLTAPPRHITEIGDRKLVFTVGGNSEVLGFRAYDIMEGSRQDQVVAVWDTESGALSGLVVGKLLGAYRTGALGGLAIDVLASPAATTCAVIGTGLQARTQLLAAAAVRPLEQVWCYSRDSRMCDAFAERMRAELDVDVVPTRSAQYAITDSEIVILATNSPTPVIAATDLRVDAHVSTVGPKHRSAHELPPEVVTQSWRIATDSPQQIAAMGQDHFVSDQSVRARIEHLGLVGDLAPERLGHTCYLSAGLAGTEVLVAAHLLAQRSP